MTAEQIFRAIMENGASGAAGVLALIILLLIRDNQRNYDNCNERVERLIAAHIEFVRSTAKDLSALMARIEHMLDKMEKVVVAAKECVEDGS